VHFSIFQGISQNGEIFIIIISIYAAQRTIQSSQEDKHARYDVQEKVLFFSQLVYTGEKEKEIPHIHIYIMYAYIPV
jgi:hypothetical protein